MPELCGLGIELHPFAEGPLEPSSHDLSKCGIEIVGDTRSEIRAIGARELASGIEIVRHVERAADAAPLGRSDRVIPNRLEQIAARLSVSLESHGGSRTVKHLEREAGYVAGQFPQHALWRVA